MAEGVLVLGGSGFVGRALVPALRASGHTVRLHRHADGPVTGVDPAGITKVINLAGRTYVPDSWRDPLSFYQANVLTVAETLAFCRAAGVPLVHVSSYVYGVPQYLPIDEGHPLSAENPYAHTKLIAESMIEFHRLRFGLTTTVIRPFNLFGPGQDDRFLVPAVVRQLLDPSVDAVTVNDLRPRRDYLHVDDLATLIRVAMERSDGGTYNAGSGASVSVEALVDCVSALAGVTKPIRETGERRQGEILDVVADVSRAAWELGWAPAVSFAAGLGQLVALDRQRGERP
jgi:nucleoside-diphosphate-sugar epimerase